MTLNEPAAEEQFTALFVAREEALAAGKPAGVSGPAVPPELQSRLERDLACVYLLRQALGHPALGGAGPEEQTQTATMSASDEATTAIADQPPAVAGYEMLGEIGRGGMGIVYKARQVALNRLVALKMILPGGHAGAKELARFRAEAEAVARLQHPHIVQVFEIGEHEGLPYFSLELCSGGSLAQKLDGTPLPPPDAAALVETLARATQAAHERGIVHRDLKPANILLASGGCDPPAEEPGGSHPSLAGLVPKITDFGLAKKQGEAGQTQSGVIVGTPSYMAPEQAGGQSKATGPGADVYALGAILYECLTGRPPFQGPTPLDTLLLVVRDVPVPVRQLQPQCPRDLETICHKCLHKETGRRYFSAAALAEDLRRSRAGEPILARPVGSIERGWRWCRRNPVVASSLAAVLLTLVVGSLVAWSLAAWALGEKGRADEQADLARTKAQEAIAKAEEARENLEEARGQKKEAKHQLAVAELRLYASKLAQAQREWQDNNVPRALELLEECQWNLRHVEHRHLWTLFNSNQRTLRGHTSAVLSVSISPDGKRIVSGSSDNTVKVWDVEKSQVQLTLQGHTGGVSSVSISPDGRRIVSGGYDSTVKVWDAEKGQELLTLKGHPGVSSVSISPDGKRIVSGGHDSTVKVWDAEEGQELFTLKGHTGPVLSVSISPDGKRIVSGSGGDLINRRKAGEVKVWDAEKVQELFTLKGHASDVTGLCISRDGRRIVSASRDGTVKVWDAQKGQELLTLKGHRQWVSSVSISPDDKRIVSGSADNTVKVWDADEGQELLTLKGHRHVVNSVSISPDGKRIVSGSADNTVKVWDAQKSQEVLTLQGHTGSVHSVSISPDGKRIVSGSGSGGGGDLATFAPPRPGPKDRKSDKPGEVKVWDADKGQELLSLQGHTSDVTSVCISQDGKRIVSGGSWGDGTVKVWDAHKGQELLTLRGHTNRITSVSISPDGKRIVSGSFDRTVKVWDVDKGREVLSLQGHTEPVNSVNIGPDGKRVVSGSADNTVKVWDADKGQELLTLKGHTFGVTSVAFSPDGKRIVSGSLDRTVKVWDADKGQELLTLRGHRWPVTSVSISPDGKRILSGSGDATVKVWDTATGQELLTLQGHTHWVTSVSISPDGKRIVSGSTDRTVKVWDAHEGP
jgi:WD40 repeat protein